MVGSINSAARKGKGLLDLPHDRKVKFLGKEYNKALYRESAQRRIDKAIHKLEKIEDKILWGQR
jgi:hypothetical protein